MEHCFPARFAAIVLSLSLLVESTAANGLNALWTQPGPHSFSTSISLQRALFTDQAFQEPDLEFIHSFHQRVRAWVNRTASGAALLVVTPLLTAATHPVTQQMVNHPASLSRARWIFTLAAAWMAALSLGVTLFAGSAHTRITVPTTHLNAQRELQLLRQVYTELLKERAQPGSGHLPKVVVFSDQHGTIDKFDELILDAIKSVLPPSTFPAGFELDPDKSLRLQLEPYIRLEDLHGKIYFHNLGDFSDRGPYGIKIFRRSLDLINAGLSDIVMGNHDFWQFMNLIGVHLPSYKNFQFYGYRDDYDKTYGEVQKVWEDHRENDVSRDPRNPAWWAAKLAEFTDYHQRKQKEQWAFLDKAVGGDIDSNGKRVKGTGLFNQVKAGLSPENLRIWEKFRGWYQVEVYTGTHAVGMVSIRWWQDLLVEFKEAYAKLEETPDLDLSLPGVKAWSDAIRMLEDQIIPALKTDLEDHLKRGEWWWRVFEAINWKNYSSPEWWAKDWIFHEGWGTAVLRELNRMILAGNAKMTPYNYMENETLRDIGQWFRDNFTLYTRDIYQNVYMHAFLPVDPKTGEFYFSYKGPGRNEVREFRGNGHNGFSSVWEGLDLIAADIRNRENSLSDIYEALSIVNSWYADNTTEAKVPHVAWAINKFGPQHLAKINGFNRLFTGHLPFAEFGDREKITETELGRIGGFQTDDIIIFTDHGMGEKFGGRGGAIHVSSDGIRLRGWASKESRVLRWDPPTQSGTEDDPTYLFEHNDPIPRERYLPKLIDEVELRIAELESKLSAYRVRSQPIYSYVLKRLYVRRFEKLLKEVAAAVPKALGRPDLSVTPRIVGSARYLGFPEWHGDVDVSLTYTGGSEFDEAMEQEFLKLLGERLRTDFGYSLRIEDDRRENNKATIEIPLMEQPPIEIAIEVYAYHDSKVPQRLQKVIERLWLVWGSVTLDSRTSAYDMRRWLQYFVATVFYLGDQKEWDRLRRELVRIPVNDYEGFVAFAKKERIAARQSELREKLHHIVLHPEGEEAQSAIRQAQERRDLPLDWILDDQKEDTPEAKNPVHGLSSAFKDSYEAASGWRRLWIRYIVAPFGETQRFLKPGIAVLALATQAALATASFSTLPYTTNLALKLAAQPFVTAHEQQVHVYRVDRATGHGQWAWRTPTQEELQRLERLAIRLLKVHVIIAKFLGERTADMAASLLHMAHNVASDIASLLPQAHNSPILVAAMSANQRAPHRNTSARRKSREEIQYENNFGEAQAIFRKGESAFRHKRWSAAIQLFHAAIPKFRRAANKPRMELSDPARQYFVMAAEHLHRAGIEIAERAQLRQMLDQLSRRKAAQSDYNGVPKALKVEEVSLDARAMISTQAGTPSDRSIVEYRKMELEKGLPIRVIAIRSDDPKDLTQGKIFILDGHHRSRAAFELDQPMPAFLITAPSAIVEMYSQTARNTHGGRWISVAEMPFNEESRNPIPLKAAIAELERLLASYDRGDPTIFPMLVNFERRGEFMTWEDIRDYLPMLRLEARKRRTQIASFRLPDDRLRIENLGPSSGVVQLENKFFSRLTRRMIDAILADVWKGDGMKHQIRDVVVIDGAQGRPAGDAFIVGIRGSHRQYRVKPTHGDHPDIEIERAKIASMMHLGPRVIHAEARRYELEGQLRTGVIVQEYYSLKSNVILRDRRLNKEEQETVGRQLAYKLNLMFDRRRDHRVLHPFDSLAENLFLIGRGRRIKVRFVEWLMAEDDLKETREEALTNRLQRLIPVIEAYMTPLVLAYFIFQIRQLSQQGEWSDVDLFESSLLKVRESLVLKSPEFKKFFDFTDHILTGLHPANSGQRQKKLKRTRIYTKEMFSVAGLSVYMTGVMFNIPTLQKAAWWEMVFVTTFLMVSIGAWAIERLARWSPGHFPTQPSPVLASA